LSQNYLENHHVVNNTLQLDYQLQHQEYNLQQLEQTNNFNTVALFGALPQVPEAVLGNLPLDVGVEPSEREVPLRLVAGNELQTVAEPAPASLVLASDALVEPALHSEHSPTPDRNFFIVTGISEVVDEAQSLPAPVEVSAAGPALPAPSPVLAIQERPNSSSLNQLAPSGSRPPSPIDGSSRKASKRSRDGDANANDPEPADPDWLRLLLQQSVPRSISQVLLGQGANGTSQSGDPDEWALVPHPSAE